MWWSTPLGGSATWRGSAWPRWGWRPTPGGRILVDRDFQTTTAGIFAAGDIIGPPGVASVSMEQARVAMCRAFQIHFKDAADPLVRTGIYTLLEVSMIGLTEAAAVTAGEDVLTGRALLEGNARAGIAGSSEGLLELVFRASDRRLLGPTYWARRPPNWSIWPRRCFMRAEKSTSSSTPPSTSRARRTPTSTPPTTGSRGWTTSASPGPMPWAH